MAIDMLNTYESAVNSADSILSAYNARRLTERERLNLPQKSNCGWEIVTNLYVYDESIKIIITVDERYPYSLPKVYTFPKLEMLKYPHVEEDGKLCIFESGYLYDPKDERHIERSLLLAYGLVKRNLSDNNEKDFHDGFLSYWGRFCKGEYKSLSLCDVSNKKSRMIYVAYNNYYGSIFHETKGCLEKFLTCCNANKHHIYETVMIYLKSPLTPYEYPHNIVDLLSLPREGGLSDDDVYRSLSNGYKTSCGHSSLLIVVPTERGICCAALSFNDKAIANGYRNMPPLNIFKGRLRSYKTIPTKTTRGDYSWVFGRDHNSSLSNIKDTNVVILGVGSVGSGVLLNLVKSGVEKITIIDGEKLSTENISRHELGFAYVNKSKAESLKHYICNNYPHVTVESYFCDWQYLVNINEIFDSANLIISCSADWPSDKLLLDMLAANDINCPVIFGFLEAYASAAHAITVPPGYVGPSFLTDDGRISEQVVSWSADPMRPLPLCGVSFQPYSCTELSYCNSLISEMAMSLISGESDPDSYIHRVWIHDHEKIILNGGKINSPYAEFIKDERAKGGIFEM
ncbi:ThiF family adenylyltransferase [Aeromonas hydrophila]|uniref:ThiF family adenylyltransferase n=1 Tax=Aeromonas hydrophila TaxID=644 RepID=UPI002B496D8F|nr:ThiF family adenylyltransferase [Aeromonas hydrophila]